MALDRFVVIANQYDAETAALADFEDVRTLYARLGILDTFDAAVLTRTAAGQVEVVQRVSEPRRHETTRGLLGGLALGAAFALFPAIHLAGGLLAGGALGAGVGAIAGHLVSGTSRSDLKILGELLDNGTSGLVVVVAPDVEEHVEATITRAQQQAHAQLQTDLAAVTREFDAV